MVQLDLFDAESPKRLARRDDPQTSHAAAQELVASGALVGQRKQVHEALCRWPDRTPGELAQVSGLSYFLIQRRISLLERAGLAEVVGRRDGQRVWRAK